MKLDPNRDGPVLAQVFEQYGWSPRQVRYVRGALRVVDRNQVYALKKSVASPEKLAFLEQVTRRLLDAGYEHLLPWVKTQSGKAYVQQGDGVWYALPWYGKAGWNGKVAIDELIRQLARLHRLCHTATEDSSEFRRQVDTTLIDRWKEHQKDVFQYREVALNREFPSPFDRALKGHVSFIDKAFSFAIQGMDKFVNREQGRPPRYTLVHGRLDPRNLLVGEDGWKWIDFDHAVLDSPVLDIASFMRRFLSLEEEEVVDPAALLKEYESEWPLTGKEKRLLALYLAYPERPFHLIRRYYEGHQGEEAAFLRRLEEEMDRLHLFQDWVLRLWQKKLPPDKNGKSLEPAGVRGVDSASR
ncbi:phosphotransferase [Paludifilum halophilum]|uniref:phosphotransferase n=1 Tax=Paludifilum halophilum TaxID=1642702 RepID=UPI00146C5EC1|nr:phosphotransferase [Paludifilum halophilum]